MKKDRLNIAITGMAISCGRIRNLRDLRNAVTPSTKWETGNAGHTHEEAVALAVRLIREAFHDAGYEGNPLKDLNKIGIALAGEQGVLDAVKDLFPQQIVVLEEVHASSFSAIEYSVRRLKVDPPLDLIIAGGIHTIYDEERSCTASHGDMDCGPPQMHVCGAVVVLQRVQNAVRANNRVRAVLQCITGVSRDSLSDADCLFNLIQRFYKEWDIDAESVSLLVTQGATIEIQALKQFFGTRKGFSRPFMCNVQDLEGLPSLSRVDASGIIMGTLALSNELLPASAWDDSLSATNDTPFFATNVPRPWFRSKENIPRRAGISSRVGHMIVEEYLGEQKTLIEYSDYSWPTELFIVSADSRDKLIRRIRELRNRVKEHKPDDAYHLAYELASRAPGNTRLAVLSDSFLDLENKLKLAEEKIASSKKKSLRIMLGVYFGESDSNAKKGKTVFLFPGQGSQHTGMLSDLCIYFTDFRNWLGAFDELSVEIGMPRLTSVLFPPSHGFTRDENISVKRYIERTDAGGLGTILASQALYGFLCDLGMQPDAMLGHSNGENTALVASGTLFLDIRGVLDSILEIQKINKDAQIDSTVRGAAIAVSITDKAAFFKVLEDFSSDIYWTMDNCPHQAVLFGKEEAASRIAEELKHAGAICTPLPFDVGFHTSLLRKYEKRLRAHYEKLEFLSGHTPLYSSITCRKYPDDPGAMRDLAARHWTQRVRFQETIEALHQAGFYNFVEVGPNNLLTAFVDDILRGEPHFAIASNVKGHPGLLQIQRLVAECFVRGLPIDPKKLYRERKLPDNHAPTPEKAKIPITQQISERRQDDERANPSIRKALMDAHFDLMSNFLNSQGRVFATLFEPQAFGSSPAMPSHHPAAVVPKDVRDEDIRPFLGPVFKETLKSLHCRCNLDIHRDLFLLDHCLGRTSNSRELSALPVVPFSFSMEILAEAASKLCKGQLHVVGMRDIRGHRWLTLNDGTLPIDIVAHILATKTNAGEKEVEVKLFRAESSPADKKQELLFEGVVMLAYRFTQPPRPLPCNRDDALPPTWGVEEFYDLCMFHGPRLQGIHHLSHITPEGFEAEIIAPPYEGYFDDITDPVFQVLPSVLDCTSQLTAYWFVEQKNRESGGSVPGSFGMFPFMIRSFHQFKKLRVPGRKLLCRGQIKVSGETLESNYDILDSEGDLVVRVEGFRYRYFRWPMAFFLYLNHPEVDANISNSWLSEETSLVIRRVDSLSREFMESAQGIWKHALAHVVLAPGEKDFWRRLPANGPRRLEWLLGRVSAKEALRHWAAKRFGIRLFPANIEILPDRSGKPVVKCPELEKVAPLVDISITHRRDCAVSCLIDDGRSIGIDLERIVNQKDTEWLKGAFDDEELASFGDTYDKLLPLWCAKEAAAKAYGTGFRTDPKHWRVTDVSNDGNSVQILYENHCFDVRMFSTEKEFFAVCIFPNK
jgi:malonyl CoA-acyl carrier protein transacylase/phosphopantetheinyl transferase